MFQIGQNTREAISFSVRFMTKRRAVGLQHAKDKVQKDTLTEDVPLLRSNFLSGISRRATIRWAARFRISAGSQESDAFQRGSDLREARTGWSIFTKSAGSCEFAGDLRLWVSLIKGYSDEPRITTAFDRGTGRTASVASGGLGARFRGSFGSVGLGTTSGARPV